VCVEEADETTAMENEDQERRRLETVLGVSFTEKGRNMALPRCIVGQCCLFSLGCF